jgi:hypothetical protein
MGMVVFPAASRKKNWGKKKLGKKETKSNIA